MAGNPWRDWWSGDRYAPDFDIKEFALLFLAMAAFAVFIVGLFTLGSWLIGVIK